MTPNQAMRATALEAVDSHERAAPVPMPGAVALDGLDPTTFPLERPGHEAAQRVMDLVIGTTAAICFLPIALLVAVVLAATVGGPVLLLACRTMPKPANGVPLMLVKSPAR